MRELITYEAIDQSFELFEQSFEYHVSTRIADVSVQLGRVAMDFSRIERVPRYFDGKRESDVEHSYMLALVAPEIARMLGLKMDVGLISEFSVLHDLVELKTTDIATFIISQDELHAKHEREQIALMELLSELPPHTAHLLLRYEQQAESEARFVKLIDKLLPIIVDIIGQGDRVMREDYEVHTLSDLEAAHINLRRRIAEAFGEEFPQIVLAHELLTRLYEDTYQEGTY